MRLIDADALKNCMKCDLNSYGAQGVLVNVVLNTIDNAPTVEPCFMTQDIIDKIKVNIGSAQEYKENTE